jgi:hypothetical protein
MIEPGVLFAAWQTSGLTVLPIHPAGVMWRRQVLLAEGGWPAQASSEHTALLMLAAEKYPAVGVDVGVLTYRTPSAQPGSGLSSQERAQWELIATQVLAARALSSQYGLRRWLHQDPSVSSG